MWLTRIDLLGSVSSVFSVSNRSPLTFPVALVIVCGIAICSAVAQDRQPAAKPGKTLPPIKEPIQFNTPEADAIVSAMQIFPADNPWNADVSKWKLHPDSGAIVAGIGNDKPLRYNTDMAFVLVA